MEDKTQGSPRQDSALEEGKQVGSPRGGLSQAQQGCSAFSRFVLEMWRRIRLEVVVEVRTR
jgi:hypothetical protein